MKNCIACGMPFDGEHASDIGIETPEGAICKYDIENGAMKSPAAIFDGGVEFFMGVAGGDRQLAERITRKNMNALPHWKVNTPSVLEGEEATDEEFATAMSKLEE